jgi:ketol-acid reductoisomerase
MKDCLAHQSGEYARDFILEEPRGRATLNARRRLSLAEHDIEKVGEKLRAMMPVDQKNKLVDASRN